MATTPFYTVIVRRTAVEETEIGRDYHNTGRKDANGNDIWEYSPSERGMKEVDREVIKLIGDSVALDQIVNAVHLLGQVD